MSRKKILIVDDNPLLSKALDICLSNKGHDVKVSYNGADAVSQLIREIPDSIVLDVRLPDCDGWFIATLLGKFGWAKTVPLIIMSVLEPDMRKITEIKPYAYIQKPFDMGQLIQTIEGSLNQGSPHVAI